MTNETILQLFQRIEEAAHRYYDLRDCHTEAIKVFEQLWIDMWNIRDYMFNYEKLRQFRFTTLSNEYKEKDNKTGKLHVQKDQFLTDMFIDVFPKAIHAYRPDKGPFIPFFVQRLSYHVRNVRKNYYANSVEVRIKSPDIQIYELSSPSESKSKYHRTWMPSDIVLSTDKVYNVIKTILGKNEVTWFVVEISTHGKQVLIKEDDLIVYYKEPPIPIDTPDNGDEDTPQRTIEDPRSPNPEDFALQKDIIDITGLELLALTQKLYEHTPQRGLMPKKMWYRILFTEKLVDILQASYSSFIVGEEFLYRPFRCESQVLSEAVLELIDYILADPKCRSFPAIMSSKMKRYSDFEYISESKRGYINFPLLQDIIIHFITDELAISRNPAGLRSSLSENRTEYNEKLEVFGFKQNVLIKIQK